MCACVTGVCVCVCDIDVSVSCVKRSAFVCTRLYWLNHRCAVNHARNHLKKKNYPALLSACIFSPSYVQSFLGNLSVMRDLSVISLVVCLLQDSLFPPFSQLSIPSSFILSLCPSDETVETEKGEESLGEREGKSRGEKKRREERRKIRNRE